MKAFRLLMSLFVNYIPVELKSLFLKSELIRSVGMLNGHVHNFSPTAYSLWSLIPKPDHVTPQVHTLHPLPVTLRIRFELLTVA